MLVMPVRVGKNRNAWGSPCPRMQPFYTRGDTWRGEFELKLRGWYFVDGAEKLNGPFASKLDCRKASNAVEDVR